MGSVPIGKQYGASALLDLLSRTWTLDILMILNAKGPTRFGALRRQLQGVSSKVLRERLRELERYKLVFRDQISSVPPSVTYGLTRRTSDVQTCLAALEQFSRKWQEEDVAVNAAEA